MCWKKEGLDPPLLHPSIHPPRVPLIRESKMYLWKYKPLFMDVLVKLISVHCLFWPVFRFTLCSFCKFVNMTSNSTVQFGCFQNSVFKSVSQLTTYDIEVLIWFALNLINVCFNYNTLNFESPANNVFLYVL